MDNEVRPTWKLAWGLWWRGLLFTIGLVIIGGIIAAAIVAAVMGVSIIPWLIPSPIC